MADRYSLILEPKLSGIKVDETQLQRDLQKFTSEIDKKYGLKLSVDINIKEAERTVQSGLKDLQNIATKNLIQVEFQGNIPKDFESKLKTEIDNTIKNVTAQFGEFSITPKFEFDKSSFIKDINAVKNDIEGTGSSGAVASKHIEKLTNQLNAFADAGSKLSNIQRTKLDEIFNNVKLEDNIYDALNIDEEKYSNELVGKLKISLQDAYNRALVEVKLPELPVPEIPKIDSTPNESSIQTSLEGIVPTTKEAISAINKVQQAQKELFDADQLKAYDLDLLNLKPELRKQEMDEIKDYARQMYKDIKDLGDKSTGYEDEHIWGIKKSGEYVNISDAIKDGVVNARELESVQSL